MLLILSMYECVEDCHGTVCVWGADGSLFVIGENSSCESSTTGTGWKCDTCQGTNPSGTTLAVSYFPPKMF